MGTVNPSLEQAYLQTFENNFKRCIQQTDSRFLSTPAIQHMGIKGISNISRFGKTELVEVTGQRNPEKQYTQMSNDNRKSKSRRFTRTYLFDKYDHAVNFVCDPTGNMYQELDSAKNRCTDRVISDAARGSVIMGRPDEAGVEVSAADDGVLYIDGTSNFDYSHVVTPAIRNFINNDINDQNQFTLAITGSEHESLMNDEKFINSHYNGSKVIETGKVRKASPFDIVLFAGTDNGVIQVDDPVLKEQNGIRENLILAPHSIAFAVELGYLGIDKSTKHVNSYEVTIDVWFKATRLDGKLVQIVKSTI